MELLHKTEYALLAMLALAAQYQNSEPLQIRQIADRYQISDRYLDQLLAELRRGGLIRSERGYKGGYRLARPPQQITVCDVVACVDSMKAQRTKKIQINTAEQSAVFSIWQESHEAMLAVLQQYTLQDLLDKQNARQQPKLMYYI